MDILFLILILGAAGGAAFVTGFIVRMFAGENAQDRTICTWRCLMIGGLNLLGVCAAVKSYMDHRNLVVYELSGFLNIVYIVIIVIGSLFLLIAFFWGVSSRGKTVRKWTFYTMRYMGLGGIIMLFAYLLVNGIVMPIK